MNYFCRRFRPCPKLVIPWKAVWEILLYMYMYRIRVQYVYLCPLRQACMYDAWTYSFKLKCRSECSHGLEYSFLFLGSAHFSTHGFTCRSRFERFRANRMLSMLDRLYTVYCTYILVDKIISTSSMHYALCSNVAHAELPVELDLFLDIFSSKFSFQTAVVRHMQCSQSCSSCTYVYMCTFTCGMLSASVE